MTGNFLFRIQYESGRYASFLSGLRTLLLDITITDQTQVFIGGLDPGDNGQFHLAWQDDVMKVINEPSFVNLNIRYQIFEY